MASVMVRHVRSADGTRIRKEQRVDLAAEDFPKCDKKNHGRSSHRAEMIDQSKRPSRRQIQFRDCLLLQSIKRHWTFRASISPQRPLGFFPDR